MNENTPPYNRITNTALSGAQLRGFFDVAETEEVPYLCIVRPQGQKMYQVEIQHYEEDSGYWRFLLVELRSQN